MEFSAVMKTLGNNWDLVTSLYVHKRLNVSQLSEKSKRNKSIISRGIDDLLRLEPKLLVEEEVAREGGGRKRRYVSLNDDGRKLLDLIFSFTEKPEYQSSSEISQEPDDKKIRYLIGEFKNEDKEISDAAWMRLSKFAERQRVWANKDYMNLVFAEVDSGSNEALNLLKKILNRSRFEPAFSELLIKKIRDTYLDSFQNQLRNWGDQWTAAQFDIMQMLDTIMSEDERNELYWNLWLEMARGIADDTRYEKFKEHMWEQFRERPLEFRESVEAELFRMMKSKENEALRKRAKQLHHFFFA